MRGEKNSRITAKEDFYPPRLSQIDSPPSFLYCRSGLNKKEIKKLFSMPAIAVVGSRKMDSYGEMITEKFVAELVGEGVVIISGMAAGIDGVAHRITIKNKGKTIAVLGSGIDIVYPQENKDIYDILSEGKSGAVISEFPLGTKPEAENFPQRNRIVAGLADAVLVVEAARKSGSLITARLAVEQGKDVFVIPGPVTSPLSLGTTWLIRQGATPVSSVKDILEEMANENFLINPDKE